MSDILPLNGTKTHPLSEKAVAVLRRILKGPVPGQEINPGMVNRLCRECLIAERMLPSPYKTHKGKPIAHFVITTMGMEVLEKIDGHR